MSTPKKIFLIIAIKIVIIAFAVYLLLKDDSKKRSTPPAQAIKEESTIQEETPEVKSESSDEIVEAPLELSMEQVKVIDKRIDEIEEGWEAAILEVFKNDLKLGEEEFKEYMMMREGYDEDRNDAYEEFYAELEEGESVPITKENKENDERILKEYQDLFKNRFGEEAYAHYANALDNFNSKLRKSEDAKHISILVIDF